MAERKISTTFTRYKHKISSEELQLLADKLVQNPENYDLMDWAAFAYYSHGDLDRAIEYYRKLVQWDPANASYHYYLANALFKLSCGCTATGTRAARSSARSYAVSPKAASSAWSVRSRRRMSFPSA